MCVCACAADIRISFIHRTRRDASNLKHTHWIHQQNPLLVSPAVHTKELTSMQSKRMRRWRRRSRVIIARAHIWRPMLLLLLLSDGRHQPPPDGIMMMMVMMVKLMLNRRRRGARGRRIVVAPCCAGGYMAGSSGGAPAVHSFDVALFLCLLGMVPPLTLAGGVVGDFPCGLVLSSLVIALSRDCCTCTGR